MNSRPRVLVLFQLGFSLNLAQLLSSSMCGPPSLHMISDQDGPNIKLVRLDDTKNSHVDYFFK